MRSTQAVHTPFSVVLSRSDEVHDFAADLRLDILSSLVAKNWVIKKPSISCFVKFDWAVSKPPQRQPLWSNYLFSRGCSLDRRHGLASVFDLREIPLAIKQDLTWCFTAAAKGVSTTDILAQTECLVERIFAFMAPYDDSHITIVNIPSSARKRATLPKGQS